MKVLGVLQYLDLNDLVSRCPVTANKWDTIAGHLRGVWEKVILLVFNTQRARCLNTGRYLVSRIFGTIFAFIPD